MSKFTLINENVNSKLTYEFKEDTLYDVLGEIECWLRGCGYYFEGTLGIVEQDSERDIV